MTTTHLRPGSGLCIANHVPGAAADQRFPQRRRIGGIGESELHRLHHQTLRASTRGTYFAALKPSRELLCSLKYLPASVSSFGFALASAWQKMHAFFVLFVYSGLA